MSWRLQSQRGVAAQTAQTPRARQEFVALLSTIPDCWVVVAPPVSSPGLPPAAVSGRLDYAVVDKLQKLFNDFAAKCRRDKKGSITFEAEQYGF